MGIKWIKAKWADYKERKALERNREEIERINKNCPFCKLWIDSIEYHKLMSNSLYMPAMLLSGPCYSHGTNEDKELFKEMNKKVTDK